MAVNYLLKMEREIAKNILLFICVGIFFVPKGTPK